MLTRITITLLLLACLSHAEQPPPEPSNPTTEDERNHANAHAKLRSLNSMSTRDLRSAVAASSNHHVVTEPGQPLGGGSPNPPKTGQEWIERMTCKSDLVVLGRVTKQISNLSENGGIVFSDYYFQVTETLFSKTGSKWTRVVVVLPGGRVETPGGVIETRFAGLHGIPVGGPPFHLLFLRQIKNAEIPNDSFHLADLAGSFFLFPNHPKNFSPSADASLKQLLGDMTREQLIAAVKQTSSTCRGEK